MIECDDCRHPCGENDCYCVGSMSEIEQMRVLGNGHSHDGYMLLYKIIKALKRARRLHSVFAEGKYQALGRVGAEFGELVRAVEKDEGISREREEIIDNIVVLIRMWLGEHEVLPEK